MTRRIPDSLRSSGLRDLVAESGFGVSALEATEFRIGRGPDSAALLPGYGIRDEIRRQSQADSWRDTRIVSYKPLPEI